MREILKDMPLHVKEKTTFFSKYKFKIHVPGLLIIGFSSIIILFDIFNGNISFISK